MPEHDLHFLDHDGPWGRQRLAYLEQAGDDSRPGLLWLQGFRSQMRSTKPEALAAFAAEQRIGLVRFDYSGHGASSGRFADCTIGGWLGETMDIFRRIARGPRIVIGSSMGAWLALLLAEQLLAGEADEAQRLRGLVLIAPAWNSTELLMWNRFTYAARAELLANGVYMRPSRYGDGPYPLTWKLISEGRSRLLDPAALALACPVRILHGMADPDVPWLHGLALAERLAAPDLQLLLVKDGDHRLSRPQDLDLLRRTIAPLLG